MGQRGFSYIFFRFIVLKNTGCFVACYALSLCLKTNVKPVFLYLPSSGFDNSAP